MKLRSLSILLAIVGGLLLLLPLAQSPQPDAVLAAPSGSHPRHIVVQDPATPQDEVGTLSYVQEYGNRVHGLISVGGYSVTVALKDPQGTLKAQEMTWPDGELRYSVDLTATIQPSDTVEVTADGLTSAIFVDPMTARLDWLNDRVVGTGPANQLLEMSIELYAMPEIYTATATVDAAGRFTATTFYYEGEPRSVDFQPEDTGVLRYTHPDANQVYLNFGAGLLVYVFQDYNRVYGYAGEPGAPVSLTLQAPDASLKITCTTTGESVGIGHFSQYFYTDGCTDWESDWLGDPVIVRSGDTLLVETANASTTLTMPVLTATPDPVADVVAGTGPATATLKVTVDQCQSSDPDAAPGCPQWVTTSPTGLYTTEPFTYSDMDGPSVTRTHDITAGNIGKVTFTTPDDHLIFIRHAISHTRAQEYSNRVEGQITVGGYSVTVRLKDSQGAVKATETTWTDDRLEYQMELTTTVQPSDTVEVTVDGATSTLFVDLMTAKLDWLNDRVVGTGPAGKTLSIRVDRYAMPETYTATAIVDAAGRFTATTFYYDGGVQSVDFQPEDTGILRYIHPGGDQVYLNFGAGLLVYAHQNYHRIRGYAGTPGAPVTLTLRASDSSVKADCTTTGENAGAGYFFQFLYTGGCSEMEDPGMGDPVSVRAGDTLVVETTNASTTISVPLLTATPDPVADVIAGIGPATATLKVTVDQCQSSDPDAAPGCPQWVTTSPTGLYTTEPFTYSDMGGPSVTRTHDITAGNTGEVVFTTFDDQQVFISHAISHTRAQEHGSRVEGQVAVGGYSVQVTLKDVQGTVKATGTAWPQDDLDYQVDLAATIEPSDTVEVTVDGATATLFVDPMTAQLDWVNDRVMGTGPAGKTFAIQIELYAMPETYTATATADASGRFTATTFYYEGTSQTVDFQPEDSGVLRYIQSGGDQVYLNVGTDLMAYVHQNHNHIYGYAGQTQAPVSITLYASDASVKAVCTTTSESMGAGAYGQYAYVGGCSDMETTGMGDPVIIRGGDTVVVEAPDASTIITVPLLTAAPNIATDRVSGVGPASVLLEATLDQCQSSDPEAEPGCPQWVPTDAAGLYTTEPFTYIDMMTWSTKMYDIVPGNTGKLYFTNVDNNIVYINYAATGVATTIAAGGLRAGATAVLGTAVPGATVEVWDATTDQVIGTGDADADARFAVAVSPPLTRDHTIVAIANGQSSVGYRVEPAVTLVGPFVSVSETVSFHGIAPAGSTLVIEQEGEPTPLVTTTVSASGRWNAAVTRPNGTYTLTALALEPGRDSRPHVLTIDPDAVAVGRSVADAGGNTGDETHVQVVGSVQPITITAEVFNQPCTVSISLMGQTVVAAAGTTPNPNITYTAVFTDYAWDWGTHEVVVNATSCGGTPVEQPVAEVTLIDPSGYVYDAVTGARIVGATATCYYSDTTAGAWVQWEAALYNNQLNPQSTDATGWYGFMVPPGDYYVTASKPGYIDNRTIVYDIPPEVTDAHIPLWPMQVTRSITQPQAWYDFGAMGAWVWFTDTGGANAVTVTVAYTYPTAAQDGLPRYYTVATDGESFEALLVLSYADEELTEAGIEPSKESALDLYRYIGNETWSPHSSVNTELNLITATNVTSFGIWGIGTTNDHPTDLQVYDLSAPTGLWLVGLGLSAIVVSMVLLRRRTRRPEAATR